MVVFETRIRTEQAEFLLKRIPSGIEIHVKGQPREGEANTEIIKELGRLTGKDVLIVRGAKTKKKTIKIEGIDEKGLEMLL